MPSKTNNLRDKLEENQLDLSLMQFTEVPVKEISELPKGTHLDLSNNLLTWLPENFPTLTHLVHLDLSKNQLSDLPEYFGQLTNLRHLDLYSNQLTKLPPSFSQLKSLKWLDLKNNPLHENLAKAAGPCITPSDCATCAKQVVALMKNIQSTQERERQKQLMHERKLEEERKLLAEMERDKIRAAKKAAKEKRRQEALEREEVAKREEELAAMNAMRHEMEQNPQGSSAKINGNLDNSQAKTKKAGCLWTLWILLVTLFFLSVGFGASLIWIYTGGHLDQRSIERALPIIQRDVDVTMAELSLKASQLMEQTRPYTKKLQENSEWLWEDFKRRNDIVAHKINLHLGPYFCASKAAFFQYWKLAQTQAGRAWASAKPFWNQFLAVMASYIKIAWAWLEKNLPVYVDFLYHKSIEMADIIQSFVNNLIK